MSDNLKSAQEFAEALRPALERMGLALKGFSDQIVATLRQKYVEEGCSYGDTEDGFQLWFTEYLEETKRQAELSIKTQRMKELSEFGQLGRELGQKLRAKEERQDGS